MEDIYYYKYCKYKYKFYQLKAGNHIKLNIPRHPLRITTDSFQLLNGKSSKSNTKTKLSWDQKFLYLEWISYPKIKTINKENTCNKPVSGFTSDMVEIYICPANKDCETYLEVEINPLGVLWIALDYNKGGDRKYGLKRKFIDCNTSGVKYNSSLKENSWNPRISIPWKLLFNEFNIKPKLLGSEWKINLFCVRSLKEQNHCTGNNDCEYTLLNPTYEFDPANYHVINSFIRVKLI